MHHTATDMKRARTGDQKAARRRAILDAADRHFAEAGFEGFSMARVGRLAGVAKGTLYLYFETREDVLLALTLDKLAAWADALLDDPDAAPSDESFAAAFHAAAWRDPALMPLLSRLDSVIEHNVSTGILIEAKSAMSDLFLGLADGLADRLGLTPAQALDALTSLGALLLGAAQADLGPDLDGCELPADVRRMTEAFASESLFITNACRILRGIRAGH